MKVKSFLLILLLIIAVLGTVAHIAGTTIHAQKHEEKKTAGIKVPTPTPKEDEQFEKYAVPKVEKKNVYTIVMIGDSMTDALGPHGGFFSEKMNTLYKAHGHQIIIDNYARPSTNILSLQSVFTEKTKSWDVTFDPLLSRSFDMILVESFAYNPLSEYGLEGGLKKQNEALDRLMKTLTEKRPHAVIVFFSTIAPNKMIYSKSVDLKKSGADREKEADERIAYLKNHIEYAKSHNIPYVNLYEKSLTSMGDGNLAYINPDDDIHPSAVGLQFIGDELTNTLAKDQLLPL